jgi:hypothetical protein
MMQVDFLQDVSSEGLTAQLINVPSSLGVGFCSQPTHVAGKLEVLQFNDMRIF